MKVTVRLLLAVLAVVLVAAPASSKEIAKAEVCGESGCTTIKDKGDLMTFANTSSSAEPPSAAPFLTVELFVTDGTDMHSWTVDYVPSAGVIRAPDDLGDDPWMQLSSSFTAEIEKQFTSVEPYPAAAFDEMLEMPAGSFTVDTLKELEASGSLATQLTPEKLAGAQDTQTAPAPQNETTLAPWLIIVALVMLTAAGALVLRHRTTRAAA